MELRRPVLLDRIRRGKKRSVSFLTYEDAREITMNRNRVPERFQEVAELAEILRPQWKRMQSALRFAGVITADLQTFYTSMKGPEIMLADQTTLTGTAKGLVTPVGPWNTFAAGEVHAQSVWRMMGGGIVTTPGSAATTLILDPIWGTTSGDLSLGVGQTSGTVAISITNGCWTTWAEMHCRAKNPDVRTTRPTVLKGSFHCPRLLTAAPIGTINYGLESATAIDADHTATKSLLLAATLGGSASFTMACQLLTLESMAT